MYWIVTVLLISSAAALIWAVAYFIEPIALTRCVRGLDVPSNIKAHIIRTRNFVAFCGAYHVVMALQMVLMVLWMFFGVGWAIWVIASLIPLELIGGLHSLYAAGSLWAQSEEIRGTIHAALRGRDRGSGEGIRRNP